MLQVGCDVCRIDALESMLKEEPAALERIFNPEEHQYALSQGRPAEHLAGVFAAKEALGKAIREPSLLGKYYREVTVSHHPDGTPTLRFSGRLTEAFSSQGIFVADLSISHDGDYAMAAVLIERKKLQCDRCLISLAALEQRGVTDRLIQMVGKDGVVSYRCPVCFRGW
jgi:holo-[acyl-carrier protein] synthase